MSSAQRAGLSYDLMHMFMFGLVITIVIAAVVGIYLHYRYNLEIKLASMKDDEKENTNEKKVAEVKPASVEMQEKLDATKKEFRNKLVAERRLAETKKQEIEKSAQVAKEDATAKNVADYAIKEAEAFGDPTPVTSAPIVPVSKEKSTTSSKKKGSSKKSDATENVAPIIPMNKPEETPVVSEPLIDISEV